MSKDINVQAARRGVLVSTALDADRTTETQLRHCCHCGFTWQVVKGSGKLRGFCQQCMGDVCGRPECVRRGCVPVEVELELLESGVPWALITEDIRRRAWATGGAISR